jgi:hypothetical protein
VERTGFAITLDERKRRGLGPFTSLAAVTLAEMAVLGLPANVRFIDLYGGGFAAERGKHPVIHSGAETHGHEPCRLECDAEHAVKLVAADRRGHVVRTASDRAVDAVPGPQSTPTTASGVVRVWGGGGERT